MKIKGLLPRYEASIKDDINLPMPEFKLKDKWSIKKSTFGQNDYIDILGDGEANPADLACGPPWLIGFKGNELQRLVRQLKFQGPELKAKNPAKWFELRKRVKYLYWRFNHKFGGRKK